MQDLIAQLFTDAARIDAERYCSYNGFIGLVLLGGALALRLAGPPDPLGGVGFVVVVASGALLLAALVVPWARPGLVPALLVAQGTVIIALALGFALACAAWAVGALPASTFRYMPGPIVAGTTYGAALCADYGPARARPRPWRLAGCIVGMGLEVVVAVLVLAALSRR